MKTEIYQRSLDELQTDLIVSGMFESERPPRAIAGLVDWRLNGFISRRIMSRVITGKFEEAVLIPLQGRLPARRVLLLGLGKQSEYTLPRAKQIAVKVGIALADLNVLDASIFLPAPTDERIVGTNQRVLLDILHRLPLPEVLLVRWLDPAIARPMEFGFSGSETARMVQGVAR